MARAQRKASTIGRLAAFLLGLIFLVAAWAKMLDPVAFASTIEAEGLAFLLPASMVAALIQPPWSVCNPKSPKTTVLLR